MLYRTMLLVALPALTALGGCMVGDATDDEDMLIEGKKSAPVRIVSHNIEKRMEVLQQTLAKAIAIDAHAVALQEVCPDQLAWLRATYGNKWAINAASNKKRSVVGCPLPDGTQDFPHDVAIYLGGTDAVATTYATLAGPENAPGNKLVCLLFERANVPVHFCSVHLISGDWKDPVTGVVYDGATVREQQTTAIKRIARDEWFDGAKNHFAILAGDFNAQPNSVELDRLYDGTLGGNGDFTEYNRSGSGRAGQETAHPDDTAAKKIDYILFSTNRAPIDGPAVDIIADASDHDMVISNVSMMK